MTKTMKTVCVGRVLVDVPASRPGAGPVDASLPRGAMPALRERIASSIRPRPSAAAFAAQAQASIRKPAAPA